MKPQNDENFDWEAQVGAKPLRLRPQNPRLAIWMGYLVSQIVGFGALAMVTLIFSRFNLVRMGDLGAWTGGILGWSQFFMIPFGMGLVGAYFWIGPVRRTALTAAGMSLLNTLLTCLCAAVILREGAICLIMAAPLLWIFMAIGVVVGDALWRKNSFLSVSFAPLFLALVFAELGRPRAQVSVVSTRFHSMASPQSLWRYAASYPRNPHPPQGWLYALGMPAPLKTSGAAKIGARRDVEMSGGVYVGAKIVVARPNRRLEFEIDRQPQHPEVTHHFVLERGSLELVPDGRGGTWVQGQTWYRLNVAPVAYFNWWSDYVVRQTHEHVFRWMDELARSSTRSSTPGLP